MRLPRPLLIGLLLMGCLLPLDRQARCWAQQQAGPPSAAAMQLFESRIMPIFRSPKPSSCVQCHLASVDIKDYILPSHVDTFLALREQGLIDLSDPSQSKILQLIEMGKRDLDEGARLIHRKTRQAEYEAFAAWIEACCQDPTLVNASVTDDHQQVGPRKPLEVVRHARKSRLVESFTRHIWSQRMRCFPCHTPNEIDPDNPKHQQAAERHREFVAKYGAKMDLFQETPEATLTRWIASSRKTKSGSYPLINLEHPTKSLIILKPTAKVPEKLADGSLAPPSASDPVSHLGGLKMHVNDQSYKSFATWIEDYAAVVGEHYLTVEDLPADNWIPTQRILRMGEVPESWGNLTTVQLFVHAQDTATGTWSPEPIAFTQGPVTPRRFVNGPLSLIRSNLDGIDLQETDQGFPLKPGKYLIKVFLDSRDRLAQSPSQLLDEEDFLGQTEIDASWRIGFPQAEMFSAISITKPTP